MRLIVVRHAVTNANERGLINGQSNDGLSEAGKASLPKLVAELHTEQLDAIYASPLQRTQDTAQPIADDHNLAVNIDGRLIEVNMGSFTLQPYTSTVELFGKTSPELLSTYEYDFTDYGGETAQQVEQRVQSFLDELKKEPYQAVCVVTHGGIVRWLYYLCTGQKVQASGNASIHHFEI